MPSGHGCALHATVLSRYPVVPALVAKALSIVVSVVVSVVVSALVIAIVLAVVFCCRATQRVVTWSTGHGRAISRPMLHARRAEPTFYEDHHLALRATFYERNPTLSPHHRATDTFDPVAVVDAAMSVTPLVMRWRLVLGLLVGNCSQRH